MSDLDLAAIRARNAERRRIRDAATPGEWFYADGYEKYDYHYGVAVRRDRMTITLMQPNHNLPNAEENCRLAAHARSDDAVETIDRLLEEVERLRASPQLCGEVKPGCGDYEGGRCDRVAGHSGAHFCYWGHWKKRLDEKP